MKHIDSLDTFDSVKSNNDYVLLKFYASWCKPCQNYAPTVESVAQSRTELTFASVDIDELPELREQFMVKSVPTLVLVKKGKKVDSLVGTTSAFAVNNWIDNTVSV